jgi:hypothetical protein
MDPNAHSSHNYLTAPASTHSSSLHLAVVPTQSYITGDNSGNLNSFNTISNTYTVPDKNPDTKELLSWLSSLIPWQRHQDIRSNRIKGTGEWLLQMEKFQAWHDGTTNNTFCCYGGPGVGKTYIR